MKICIIEDENILRITLRDELKDKGYSIVDFDNPVHALNFINENPVDIVVSDIKMPYMNGHEVLAKIKTTKPEIAVILMTAYGTINAAVNAVKAGAYDYLTKPFDTEDLLNKINHISETLKLKKEARFLQSHFLLKFNFDSYIGSGEYIENLKSNLKIISETNSTVLITGETGTGKELVASIIHFNSTRRNKPFIKVSCAILSREIFESELFGHEKGAYTGAIAQRTGRFEQADGGTLYLDDIDDIPLDLQVKLLRVLQEQEIERVGGNRTIKIDVRVISSTKANLRQLVSEGKFREDLFYRLNVLPVNLEPLRNHKEDIESLCNHFIRKFTGTNDIAIADDALTLLKEYNWQGNIREIKNIVERLIIFSKDNKITGEIIPYEIKKGNVSSFGFNLLDRPLNDLLNEVELQAITLALEKTNYNKNKAAEILGLPPSTLKSKIEKFKIKDK